MFVTLEGMEGSGKSTLLKGLAQSLSQQGRVLCQTREPGGCGLGQTLRSLLLHTESEICPEAELFLFLADRAQHVREIIKPALAEGKLVLCDRFADSTIVYQGYARGFEVDLLRQLNHVAIDGLWPDLTLVVDVPPEVGLERARSRNRTAGLDRNEGRFEAETLNFHSQVREGFLDWAARNPTRCVVLDGTCSPSELLYSAMNAMSAVGKNKSS